MQFVLGLIIFLYILSSVGYFSYMLFQKNRMYYIAQILMFLGLVLHTVLLVFYGIKCHRFPVGNLHEILLVIAWSTATVFFTIQRKHHLKLLGIYAAPICAITVICSCNIPQTLFNDPKLFQSVWLAVHVFAVFLSNSALTLACAAGILYIIQENAIKKKKRGFFFNRLPSLELLDATGHICIVMGFILLTIGLGTGLVYANAIWGHFWSWDPKEICSTITWIFYAVLLQGRMTVRWRGRKSAIMTIVGLGVLLFTFLGVNFLLRGHHSFFMDI